MTTVSASHNETLFFKMEMLLPPDDKISDFLSNMISYIVMEEYTNRNIMK